MPVTDEISLEPPAAPARAWPGAVSRLVSIGLLAASVVLHVVAMFPNPYGRTAQGSIVSQPDQAGLYAVVAAAWAAALGLSLLSRKANAAAGFAVGLAIGEVGYRLADLGEVFRYGTSQAGAGLWLMIGAWGAGALGALAAVASVLVARRRAPDPGSATAALADDPPRGGFNRTAAMIVAGILSLATAGFFLPPWDHYAGVSRVAGQLFSANLGNAFDNPWQVVAGNVLTAAAIALVPIVAVHHMWRDRAAGAAAVGGVLSLLAAQFVSGVVGVDQALSPAAFGFSGAQARNFGLVIVAKLTGWFLVDALCAFGLLLIALFVATATRVEVPWSPAQYSWWDPYRGVR